jgi:DNA polymerase-3 subunit alpha
MGVCVGPARGSAGGLVVARLFEDYQYRPIDVQPAFERFLNPDQVSSDTDIDFDDGRSSVMISCIWQPRLKQVAQIITYG